MSSLRQPLTWLFAAGYAVVAVVVGGGHPYLHDHGGTGDVGDVVVCAESDHEHHHGHHHGHDHSASDHHNHHPPEPSCPAGHHEHDGDCVVCQYLAQQPLPVAIETAPALSEWRRPVVVVAESQAAAAPQFPHPARGPPLAA